MVKEIIHLWKQILITDSDPIQLSIVYTYPHTTRFLLNIQDRNTPQGRTRTDKTFIKKIMNLSFKLSQFGRTHAIRRNGDRVGVQLQVDAEIYIPIWRHTRKISRKHFLQFKHYRNRFNRGRRLSINIKNMSQILQNSPTPQGS